jgi:hypothetical protein
MSYRVILQKKMLAVYRAVGLVRNSRLSVNPE